LDDCRFLTDIGKIPDMVDILLGDAKPPSRPPNCLKCVHFRITCDPKYPRTPLRACGIFSFMSPNMPSMEVFKINGAHCPSFQMKSGLK